MPATELTTIAKVKTRAGIPSSVNTFDSSLALIVPAVNARIAEVCSRNFTSQVYAETRYGNGNKDVTLRNGPISNIYYAATGRSGVIDIKFIGTTNLGSINVLMDMGGDTDGQYKIQITEGFSVTDIDLDETKTIADVVAEIDALVNWEATLMGDVGVYPSLAILPNFYPNLRQDEKSQISMPIATLGLQPLRTVEGEYDSNRAIGKSDLITVIYKGGYDTIPDNLVDAATQIALNTFNQSQTDQTLKGETIGNYSWTSAVSDFISEQLPAWYSVLNNFKNPVLA